MKNVLCIRSFRSRSAFAFSLLVSGFSLLVFSFSLSTAVSAQRDYFTPEEVELIRNAQQIDQRINVLTHAIDRRFTVLKIDVGGPKIAARDADGWGALPQGSRFDILLDIKRILQKAIDDIDNISERPDSAIIPYEDEKHPKSFAELFPKAVRDLAASAQRYGPILKTELDNSKDDAEKGTLMDAIDSCDQIIAAVVKLPAEAPKPTGKKH